MTLLVALAVHAANATEQITKLTIGKFFLHCKGDCSTESKFRDKGYLSFGTDKKVIKIKKYCLIYSESPIRFLILKLYILKHTKK